MALRAFLVLLSFAGAVGEDVAGALASDDTCAAGQDCSLELHQLRGMKVNYLEALEDASDDEEDEEEAVYVEEEAEVEGGGCTNPKDMKVWKKGGKKTFDASLNHCGRSCAAGFPCTKDRQPRRLCGIQVFRWCSVSAAAGSWDSGTEVSSCCFAFLGCRSVQDCMQKKGYSSNCASCMAQLVGCSRDHCMNQCTLAFDS